MKKTLLINVVLLLMILAGVTNQVTAQSIQAQVKPLVFGDSVLCPNASGVLYTQKIYDTYQWYVRDFFSDVKTPVAGATTAELVVTNDDILKYFSVEVSVKKVKRSSDEKLIDGHVFVFPSVISSGDFKNGPGFFVLKQGDTGVFTLMQPYNTNITWYKNGKPIPGETKNKLFVTEAGSYTVSGAPDVCPDYIQNLGVDLVVKVRKAAATVPVITGDTLLCPNSSGTLTTQAGYDSYQWYKRFFGTNKKKPVKGATSNTLTVDAFNDAPAYFSVTVTSKGDSLTSAEKLVDSYAFLPLSVVSDGDFINGPGYFKLNNGDTGTFTITQPYNTSITWFRNNIVIPGENNVTLDVTKGGNYFVTAAPAVCPEYIQNPGLTLQVKLIDNKLQANEQPALNTSTTVAKEIKLYPNPAKGFVTIDMASFAGSDIKITLSGSDGKTVLAKQFAKVAASVKLDLAAVNPGVYYATIKSNSTQQVLKLVLTK